MPPTMNDSMSVARQHAGAAMVNHAVKAREDDDQERRASLFPSPAGAKRRKFIIIEDDEKRSRIRVKVTLDEVKMSEIPDSYRKSNSVYPRAYYPVQMAAPQNSAKSRRFSTSVETEDGPATVGRTLVPVPTPGEASELAVPQLSRAKKDKEEKLNDLAYRMSWCQSRTFAGRTLFLQKSRKS